MLMQRVITALLLLPLLLAAIWFLPTPALYAVFSAAGLLVAWEWTGLMGLRIRGARFAYVGLTALLLAAVWGLRAWWPWIAGAASAWWLVAAVLLFGYPGNFQRRPPTALQLGVIGQFLILPTMLSLAVLHGLGREHPEPLRLMYVFFLIFAADTGAYFAGRRFGRHKLAPAVSPGKTIEGAAGGLLLCAVWAWVIGTYVFHLQPLQAGKLLALSLVVAVVSIVGDLTESMFKRSAGVKDSGNLLPGHGGILDRVDSLLAAAPAMALGFLLAGF